MKDFTGLFMAVEQTTKTNAKIEALVHYFREAKEEDKIWCIAVLTGNTPRRTVKTSELREWTAELSGLPLWLFEESYYIVGDLAETIALSLPDPEKVYEFSLQDTLALLYKLDISDAEGRKAVIQSHWMHIPKEERFVFNKLITGNFRMGVSRQLVIKALAIYLDQAENDVAHRLMGKWNPEEEHLGSLFRNEATESRHHQPYPFFLAYQLEAVPDTLGPVQEWMIEKKFDGIRGQIIVRNGELFVWSRGEELMTDKFPELSSLKDKLPEGTVLDGELIPWKDNAPLPFQVMQTRIGRKKLTPKILADAPVVMICYDLLELDGRDIRNEPLSKRRASLEQLLATHDADAQLKLSPLLHFDNWADVAAFRKDARDAACEGVMIKNRNSVYETGRRRGNWWKWKTAPLTVDGVLIYAQSGHGRRANLFTDYTFAVWDEGTLVPFAKAYSGLTDKEITELDNWVKRHTLEKFGPVRSVTPELVFEIAFEGINESPRHKSGVALRFPRILRWRRDKAAADANTKNDLLDLLAAGNI